MHKHRGFPSRLPGTDYQFTIRRPNKKGATPIIRRERYADRRNVDRKADEVFMLSLIESFGEEVFELARDLMGDAVVAKRVVDGDVIYGHH